MLDIIPQSSSEVETGVLNWLRPKLQAKTLLLLCGGSTVELEAQIWQALSTIERATIRLSLTDERYGGQGHPNSNWEQLRRAGIAVDEPRHIAVLKDNDSIEETAHRWQNELIQALSWADNVLAIFGVGEDSHIAGIKPGSPAAHEQVNLVAQFNSNDFARVTVAPPFFACIDAAVISAKAPKKAEVLQSLLTSLDPIEFPSQLIKRAKSWQVFYEKEDTRL